MSCMRCRQLPSWVPHATAVRLIIQCAAHCRCSLGVPQRFEGDEGEHDPMDTLVCMECGGGDDEDVMLICDGERVLIVRPSRRCMVAPFSLCICSGLPDIA